MPKEHVAKYRILWSGKMCLVSFVLIFFSFVFAFSCAVLCGVRHGIALRFVGIVKQRQRHEKATLVWWPKFKAVIGEEKHTWFDTYGTINSLRNDFLFSHLFHRNKSNECHSVCKFVVIFHFKYIKYFILSHNCERVHFARSVDLSLFLWCVCVCVSLQSSPAMSPYTLNII